MSFDGKRLAEDLLEQAKVLLDLAKPDSDGPDQAAGSSRPEKRGRPKEAKLRRSISTAYYSLFSLLVYEAATVVVGVGKEKKALRGYVIRAISHETIRNVCRSFASRNPDEKIKEALDGHEIPIDLVDIARICHNLQVQRHEATVSRRWWKLPEGDSPSEVIVSESGSPVKGEGLDGLGQVWPSHPPCASGPVLMPAMPRRAWARSRHRGGGSGF